VTKTTFPLRLTLTAVLLTVLTHVALLGWLRREMESVQYVSPIRDKAVIVSLEAVSLATSPQVASELKEIPRKSLPARQQPAPPSKKSPELRQNLPQSSTNDASLPNNSGVVNAPSNGGSADAPSSASTAIGIGTGNDPRSVSENMAATSGGAAAPIDVDNGKELPRQTPIFPDGPGPLVQSGAFPYSFFFGEYTDGNLLGAGTFFVESSDGAYKLLLTAKASGLTSLLFNGAAYRSEGLFDNAGFRPKIYGEKSNNRSERIATVDYGQGQVSIGDQKRSALAGMQDRLSVTWQIGLLLKAFPDLSIAGSSVPVPLLAPRSLENAQFVSQGWTNLPRRVDLSGGGGVYKTVHFKFKSANELNKTQIDLWYETDRLPQPLRVRWIDDRQRTVDILRAD
jgi:hypothetical protein